MAVWRKATSPCTNAVATNLLGSFNSLRPRLNRRPLTDDIFKCIFFNENVWISIKISLKFVPKGPINNVPALVQIMAWRRPADKPLSEPVIVSLLTHICVTRPQWVKVTLGSHLLFFFIKIQIRWKIRFAVTPFLAMISQLFFTNVTIANLSSHVQIFAAIHSSILWLVQINF